jgi:hypothetical protein
VYALNITRRAKPRQSLMEDIDSPIALLAKENDII